MWSFEGLTTNIAKQKVKKWTKYYTTLLTNVNG